MTNEKFTELYRKAHDADEAFERACKAAGYDSRWDVSRAALSNLGELRDSYYTKIEADEDLHLAFEAMRLAKAEA
jgi:hypothetical protein